MGVYGGGDNTKVILQIHSPDSLNVPGSGS